MKYCLEESKDISQRNKTRTLITLKNVIMERLNIWRKKGI